MDNMHVVHATMTSLDDETAPDLGAQAPAGRRHDPLRGKVVQITCKRVKRIVQSKQHDTDIEQDTRRTCK